MTTIGFIGIGTMGSGMVQNLARKGYTVLAYNRTARAAETLVQQNISQATLLQVQQCNIVITCLAHDEALRETLLHTKFIANMNTGAVLIDCGTTSLEMTEELRQASERNSVQFIDAPVTGSKIGAENGTLLFMVGADEELFTHVLPVLEAMGTKHVRCGPTSYGQRAKIALNMTQALMLESYLEGLTLAVKNGVPQKAMVEILENSGAKCGIGSAKFSQIVKGDFTPRFKLSLMRKDLLLAEREVEKLQLSLPLAKEITNIYTQSLQYAEEDICATAKTLETHNHFKFTQHI
jgi:3-hydroxyisobutyrate dehydrogenase-like beta-hydroxyacid dehydrogenase